MARTPVEKFAGMTTEEHQQHQHQQQMERNKSRVMSVVYESTTLTGSCASSSSSSVVPFVCFDGYVSGVVGSTVDTGLHRIELAMEEQQRLQEELAAQAERFRIEDAKIAAYVARLKAESAASSKGSSRASSLASPRSQASSADAEDADDDTDFDVGMLEYDPVDYRQYDLYKVLGLEQLRGAATAEDIKNAYRRRVVRHHPDKLKQRPRRYQLQTPGLDDDSFFKLVQKAWQVLTDPARRADFDACEPTFDTSAPSEEQVARVLRDAGEPAFYALLAPVFARNARWSRQQPVPHLGDAASPRADVERFYSFWVGFESVRRFDWLDEDEPAGTENRDDRRFMEKKNRAARDRRKKEDTARIMRLVELASKRDPRLARFRDEDRAAKAARQAARAASRAPTPQAQQDAALREAAAAAAAAKLAAEAAQRDAAAAAAASRQTAKLAIKAARKAFRDAIGAPESWCRKDARTVQAVAVALEKAITSVGEEVPRLDAACTRIRHLEAHAGRPRADLAADLLLLLDAVVANTVPVSADAPVSEDAPVSADAQVSADAPVSEGAQVSATASSTSVPSTSTPAPSTATPTPTWTVQETDLLINAAKQYPGGSANRWEQITACLNRHIANGTCATSLPPGTEWTVDQVIRKAAELKDTGSAADAAATALAKVSLQAAASAVAPAKRDPRVDLAQPTIAAHYYGSDADRAAATATHGAQPVALAADDAPWAAPEQLALEAALKAVPVDDPLRWDRIAQLVPGRSRRECLARVKEIATLLKHKKLSEQ